MIRRFLQEPRYRQLPVQGYQWQDKRTERVVLQETPRGCQGQIGSGEPFKAVSLTASEHWHISTQSSGGLGPWLQIGTGTAGRKFGQRRKAGWRTRVATHCMGRKDFLGCSRGSFLRNQGIQGKWKHPVWLSTEWRLRTKRYDSHAVVILPQKG